ncbi:MAG: type II toxin-antitoxin system MqsA family antitoxin [Schwartzia sp.]|nr:type II toxin-antitoxin system MqsA family antitoxin [Schwartzia sp. (in: firmicutes)]
MEKVRYDAETGEKLTWEIRPLTITYKGHSKTIDMPGWYPSGDGEATFLHEDLKAYDKALKQLMAETEHLLQPSEIRAIRKQLKMTQVQAGTILGGGKTAFQKYESGETLPSRAISNLLRVLSKEPSLVNLL